MWWHKKQFPWRQGFYQATAVAGYMLLVSQFMANAQKIMGKLDQSTGPILFLFLLGFSVMVCGLLVLAKPFKLFVDNKGGEALDLVLATAKWMGVYLILTILAFWIW